jgi:hypothetical protein
MGFEPIQNLVAFLDFFYFLFSIPTSLLSLSQVAIAPTVPSIPIKFSSCFGVFDQTLSYLDSSSTCN